jgi:hypothetical protein
MISIVGLGGCFGKEVPLKSPINAFVPTNCVRIPVPVIAKTLDVSVSYNCAQKILRVTSTTSSNRFIQTEKDKKVYVLDGVNTFIDFPSAILPEVLIVYNYNPSEPPKATPNPSDSK